MAGFHLGVFKIRIDEQWKIEKYLLAFPPRDSVFLPTFFSVSLIPLKALDMVWYLHGNCIYIIYTKERGLSSGLVLPNGRAHRRSGWRAACLELFPHRKPRDRSVASGGATC